MCNKIIFLLILSLFFNKCAYSFTLDFEKSYNFIKNSVEKIKTNVELNNSDGAIPMPASNIEENSSENNLAIQNISQSRSASQLKKELKQEQKKQKKKKSKNDEPKEKMVETRQEYEQKAINIPLEERTLPDYKQQESTKEFYYPKDHFILEKYNYPQGSREVNIEKIKSDLNIDTYMVADKEVQYGAYAKYYFLPEFNQISSSLYVEKLDTSQNKINRIINFKQNQQIRLPIIKSGVDELYQNLYNGLNVVDWSSDSKKLLIKEKIGSLFGGIYKTYLYVYYMPDEIRNAKLIKLDEIDKAINYYFTNWEDLQIVQYRYDIEPLGFMENNDNIIVFNCIVYDKDGNKMFLGNWGFDLVQNQAILFSKTQQNQQVSSNGLVIKKVIN